MRIKPMLRMQALAVKPADPTPPRAQPSLRRKPKTDRTHGIYRIDVFVRLILSTVLGGPGGAGFKPRAETTNPAEAGCYMNNYA
jgi:hypothetical protein